MRFFTSFPLIFLLSQQTNAIWPFTSTERSAPSVPEIPVPPTPVVPAVGSIEPHFIQGFDYRSFPAGYFAFPNVQAYIKGEPVLFQQSQEEEQTQQTEQTPDTDGGTKGGSSGSGGTKSGSTSPPTKGTFFGRFWRTRKAEVNKEDFVKPEVVQPVDPLAVVENPPGTVVSVPVSVEGVSAEAVPPAVSFENSGVFESDHVPDNKDQTRNTAWNWIWNNNQAQQVADPVIPVATVPVVGVAHPVETSNDPHVPQVVTRGSFSGIRKIQPFTLPQFSSIKLPNFNIFDRKPVVRPQQVSGQPVPGQYCQCFNAQTGLPVGHQPAFGFPYPFSVNDVAPDKIVNDPYPGTVYDNSEKKNHNKKQVTASREHSFSESVPLESHKPSVGSSGTGNVRVVVSGPDHTFLDTNDVPTKVIFPVTTSESGSVHEPIAAESAVDQSTVSVAAPAPVPIPAINNTPSISSSEPVATIFSEPEPTVPIGSAPAKAIQTFSGSVPGGSTTPQVMKGKEFSISKSKFVSASASAKSVKKQ